MAKEELTYREAISAALADEMRSDPTVLVLGEDIGSAGGPLKTTVGLYDEFGEKRVRDTPIAENGFVGAALGLALTGYRPVVEIMFSDFLGVCFDQIVNSIAKHRFMSGGHTRVPLVIRAIGGGTLRFGPQHSQTGETWLLPFPGIKIAMASSPNEAYRMLRASIRDDNPVLLVEHKALLGAKAMVERDLGNQLSLGGPEVVRDGTDVTIVSSLAMLPRALEAAETLTGQGVSAEVVDMRVLRPFDVGTILRSVKKTNRLMTVEEQTRLGGWGAEVVACIANEAFDYLDAPPLRLSMPDHPTPYSPPVEDAVIPSVERIAEAARGLMH